MSGELTSFEALHAFRNLSDAERMESLFLGQREALREAKGITIRLDVLNGTTQTTAKALSSHLDEHGDQQAGIDFIRVWGARGTGVILFFLAAIGGANIVLAMLDRIGR